MDITMRKLKCKGLVSKRNNEVCKRRLLTPDTKTQRPSHYATPSKFLKVRIRIHPKFNFDVFPELSMLIAPIRFSDVCDASDLARDFPVGDLAYRPASSSSVGFSDVRFVESLFWGIGDCARMRGVSALFRDHPSG